jgi:hypothetical protein
MDREYFISYLNESRKSIVEDLMSIYEKPPGRKPHQKLLEISKFYHSLSKEEDKEAFKKALDDAACTSIFGILCILDHVRFLEDTEEKTTFELYAVKEEKRILLNEFEDEPLHDMFNGLVMEDS